MILSEIGCNPIQWEKVPKFIRAWVRSKRVWFVNKKCCVENSFRTPELVYISFEVLGKAYWRTFFKQPIGISYVTAISLLVSCMVFGVQDFLIVEVFYNLWSVRWVIDILAQFCQKVAWLRHTHIQERIWVW